MGRPKVYDRRIFTGVRLPESLHRELSRVAEQRGTSINKLLCKAAERYLENLPSLEPVE